ncbi:MAG: serine hydrolase [Bacteroidetes bacterium]|nr:serine hydrolase [Bacteroidota bacterium]
MRPLLVLALLLQTLTAQQDALQEKFGNTLRSTAGTADAVVGIVVKDLRTGEQFRLNDTEVFPTASSIKVFILAEVYRQAAEGKFSLSDIRPLTPAHRVGGSGVLSLLGERTVSMSIRDYCVLMIQQSDNTATNLLIDLVGMKNVNAFAAKNGCISTLLQRVMMDVAAAKAGRENISSPADLASIMERLYKGEVVSPAASKEMLGILSLEKDGALREGLPAAVALANKGGEIDGVRCDAGIVMLEGSPYVICVMTKMLLREQDGTGVISAVSRTAYQYFERKVNSNQYGRRIPR